MNCPKCRSHLYFLTEPGGEITACRSCSFESRYFEPNYEDYVATNYQKEAIRTPENDPLIKRADEMLKLQKHESLLDFGCGAGDYTYHFSKISNQVMGADIDTSLALQKFPNNKFINIPFKQRKLPFESGTIDCIIAINVIEHVRNPQLLLSEFRRILKKNGRIFITTFDTNFILHGQLNDPTHLYEWSHPEFVDFVSRYFVVKESESYGSFFNYKYLNRILVRFLKPEVCVLGKKEK